jgi:hypothetical protein
MVFILILVIDGHNLEAHSSEHEPDVYVYSTYYTLLTKQN